MWDLAAEFQVCITTDSGVNIVSATKRHDWLRLSCFGQNLHKLLNHWLMIHGVAEL